MIILASGSPRRKEILSNHGIDHRIIKPEVDETLPSVFFNSLTAEQTVLYLALKKGLAVYNSLNIKDRNKFSCVVSADTVVFDKHIIGKPTSINNAIDILYSLRNKHHYVLTGVAIIQAKTGYPTILCDTSKVFFKDYSIDDVKKYVKGTSPLDKAGAYAIQSKWKEQVDHIEGDLENIIGLPWYKIEPILSALSLQ